MRFAAVRIPSQQPPRTPAADVIRRLVWGEPMARQRPAPPPQEPPADLDQRVRLAGEW